MAANLAPAFSARWIAVSALCRSGMSISARRQIGASKESRSSDSSRKLACLHGSQSGGFNFLNDFPEVLGRGTAGYWTAPYVDARVGTGSGEVVTSAGTAPLEFAAAIGVSLFSCCLLAELPTRVSSAWTGLG